MTTTQLPALAEGERYIGCIGNAEGQLTHIILLPGDFTGTWKKAKAWAESIGGELPNRVEQALMFATAKEAFEPEWHWSGEQHASGSDYAWSTDVTNGYQTLDRISSKYRARAVRRLVIQ